jgi:Fic family protein
MLDLCVEYALDSTHMMRRKKDGMYIHERAGWPGFRWDHERISARLVDIRHRQGLLMGRMQGLGFQLRAEAVLHSLTEEVLKSSEIEGEKLDRDQVRSSIARRLGLDIGGLTAADRDVEGVVEMMLDATQGYDKPLTGRRLFDWHAALFPTGRSGMSKIRVGAWRDDANGPMQVVSGPIGKERVHYEAPAAERVRDEMRKFVEWFEKDHSTDLVLKAGVAHLWFVTIHPFDDGNGRIARAIADMVLARSEDSPQRFYSMSAQIRQERKAYYEILEATQKGDLDITRWLEWFLECLGRAFERAETILASVLGKARFWERFTKVEFNERQREIVNRLLNGFEGKLTTSKWAKLAKCSHDTALRDIEDLIGKKVLVKDAAGGRSTSYSLVQAK